MKEVKFKIRTPVKIDNDELIGKRFERLVVTDYMGKINGFKRYRCKCDCGNYVTTTKYRLLDGTCKSCGCYAIEVRTNMHKTHGLYYHKLHNIWSCMKYRCNNKNHKEFNSYGGKGIKVCDDWNNFINFYNWAISNGYKDGLSIDRIDGNKGYSPNNCRFITMKQQQENKIDNVFIKYKDKVYTVSKLSSILGISKKELYKCNRNKSLYLYNCEPSNYNEYIKFNNN